MYSDDEATGCSLSVYTCGANDECASAYDADGGFKMSEYSVYYAYARDAGYACECADVRSYDCGRYESEGGASGLSHVDSVGDGTFISDSDDAYAFLIPARTR